VVLDDSLYAPWLAVADLATDSATPLRAVWPRTGRSGPINVRRRATADGGSAVEVTGTVSATIEVTRDDRLLRVILPGRDVSVGPLPQ
jgi:hypothetical protein